MNTGQNIGQNGAITRGGHNPPISKTPTVVVKCHTSIKVQTYTV